MSYTIDIKVTPAVRVATLTTRTTMATIAPVIDKGFATVMAAIEAAGTHPVGAPFIVYHEMFDEVTEGTLQICIPVPPDTTGDAGEVTFTTFDETTVAWTTHEGPYAGIGQAYAAVASWVQDNGHTFAGPPREVYVTDPRTVAESDLLTEVQFPIVAAP